MIIKIKEDLEEENSYEIGMRIGLPNGKTYTGVLELEENENDNI